MKAPKAGLRALVTVEREGVWSRRVVTLKSTAEAVEVPITAEMAPNAFVTVLAVEGAPPADTPDAGKPGIWYGVTPLTVESEGQRVEVALTTDRDATTGRQGRADRRSTCMTMPSGPAGAGRHRQHYSRNRQLVRTGSFEDASSVARSSRDESGRSSASAGIACITMVASDGAGSTGAACWGAA